MTPLRVGAGGRVIASDSVTVQVLVLVSVLHAAREAQVAES